jgi:hypothetical protein
MKPNPETHLVILVGFLLLVTFVYSVASLPTRAEMRTESKPDLPYICTQSCDLRQDFSDAYLQIRNGDSECHYLRGDLMTVKLWADSRVILRCEIKGGTYRLYRQPSTIASVSDASPEL